MGSFSNSKAEFDFAHIKGFNEFLSEYHGGVGELNLAKNNKQIDKSLTNSKVRNLIYLTNDIRKLKSVRAIARKSESLYWDGGEF